MMKFIKVVLWVAAIPLIIALAAAVWAFAFGVLGAIGYAAAPKAAHVDPVQTVAPEYVYRRSDADNEPAPVTYTAETCPGVCAPVESESSLPIPE